LRGSDWLYWIGVAPAGLAPLLRAMQSQAEPRRAMQSQTKRLVVPTNRYRTSSSRSASVTSCLLSATRRNAS
jgi:hypothetical protein